MGKEIDLPPEDWKSDRKSKYPRKLWFGLTDYGPPPLTWDLVLQTTFVMAALVIGRLLFGH